MLAQIELTATVEVDELGEALSTAAAACSAR
jgi:hypothetical protein